MTYVLSRVARDLAYGDDLMLALLVPGVGMGGGEAAAVVVSPTIFLTGDAQRNIGVTGDTQRTLELTEDARVNS